MTFFFQLIIIEYEMMKEIFLFSRESLALLTDIINDWIQISLYRYIQKTARKMMMVEVVVWNTTGGNGTRSF